MTKASEELHISQPAISQSIKKLEDELGGTLFLRSNKGMNLTSEGKMFFEYVKGALELINNAENEFTSFKDLSKGEIKIGVSTTLTKLILLEPLKKFHLDYPNINISITNDLTSNLVNDLKLGKLDFIIFNESNIKESNLELLKLKELKKERNKQRELARAKKKFGINTLENTTSNFSLSQQEAQVLLKLAKQVVGKDNSVINEKSKEGFEKESYEEKEK